ncbi:MAG: DCC1-like thiol-disulfide oxidoreductase family protein [Pseudomonadota bacterium]
MHKRTDAKPLTDNADITWLIYDGDCPLCQRAVSMVRFKHCVGPVEQLNARTAGRHWILDDIKRLGLDLDEGMVLRYAGQFHHGQDALYRLGVLSTRHGWFNRLNALLFQSKGLARIAYPLMRAGRNGLLRIKGVPKIRNLDDFDPPG